jgi:hypothetical protein
MWRERVFAEEILIENDPCLALLGGAPEQLLKWISILM